MKRRAKLIAVSAAVILLAVCMLSAFTGCRLSDETISRNLNEFADEIAMAIMGNDAFGWNVFSVSPETSFGYVKEGESEWYSYSKLTDSEAEDAYYSFYLLDKQLHNIPKNRLHGVDTVTYNALESLINSYLDYYDSDYAAKFSLIGAGYINSQGGYVADFTNAVENYTFRRKEDVDDLLSLTRSTKQAFATYLDYVRDRRDGGYPLYDYTIEEMKAYLDEVISQGDNYYLYDFVDRKIDGAQCLSAQEKSSYKSSYKSAIKNYFLAGVKTLSDGLADYIGSASVINKSYLASYGEMGKDYYSWSFENKTGLSDLNLYTEYDRLIDFYEEYDDMSQEVLAYVESVKDSNAQLYADFNAYLDGEKLILGLSDPEDMLEYLKGAAENIVPDLNNEPKIDFKYMDETVAKRSNTMAYYLKSPVDEVNSAEHITLNPFYASGSSREPLLTTIAHEGYPGHLYARVKSKEQGLHFISSLNSTSAFAEGWAVYTQLALLDNIIQDSTDEALNLYCEYLYGETVSGYISMLLFDIQINYLGVSVQDLTRLGYDEDTAQSIIETFMEIPTVYVSYAYGVYSMINLHEQAKTALGNNYNEVEFNGVLLSEGDPTLERAQQITRDYIASHN